MREVLLGRTAVPDPRLLPPLRNARSGAADLAVLEVGDLRARVEGCTVAVVDGPGALAHPGSASRIAAADLVVRVGSLGVRGAGVEVRTDLHVLAAGWTDDWGVRVPARVVVAKWRRPWQRALRRRVVPGAQRALGGESLKWPSRLLGDDDGESWRPAPMVARLVDFLGVAREVRCYGFDAGLDASPVGEPADRARELAWLAASTSPGTTRFERVLGGAAA